MIVEDLPELVFRKGEIVWVRGVVEDIFNGDRRDEPAYWVRVAGRLGKDETIPVHLDDVLRIDTPINTVMEMPRFVQLAEPGIMLDIGCNHGIYLEHMTKKATKVMAFEPHPENVAYIDKVIKEKGLSNVEVHPVALTDVDKDIQLFVHSSNPGGHSIILGEDSDQHKRDRTIIVPGRTLDSYGLTGVTGMKIDVESAELVVLKGAKQTFLNNKMWVELETHHRVDQDEVYSLIKEYGYKVYHDDDKDLSRPQNKLKMDQHYLLTNCK